MTTSTTITTTPQLLAWLLQVNGNLTIEKGVITTESGETVNLQDLAKRKDEEVGRMLPLLRDTVWAKVQYYNAMREIECELGHDAPGDTLDELVESLAFNCDTLEDVREKITEKEAAEVFEFCGDDDDEEEEEEEEEEGGDDEA